MDLSSRVPAESSDLLADLCSCLGVDNCIADNEYASGKGMGIQDSPP
jgi:hypothetical protein